MSGDSWSVGPLTRTDIVRYQGASGDMNPVHHDEPFAAAAGFPAPLGVGMLPAGMMAAWAAGRVGEDGPVRVRSVRVRWKAPFFPGVTLTFREVARRSEDGLTHLELACDDQDGALLVQGWMTFADD